MAADAPGNYIIAILFDISAAFDSLTWPFLFRELASRQCPADLAHLIQDYLTDRSIELRGNFTSVRKPITRGCPQGSILGPEFWNVVFDSLLRLLASSEYKFAAYADDLIILASADTRRDLERQGQDICSLVHTWTQAHHLQLSTSKTEMVALRGSLHRRPPILRLSGEAIRYVHSARYLGIYFSTGFHIGTHLQKTGDRCKSIFTIFGQAARSTWGLRFPILSTYYDSIFLPTITFAAGSWGDQVGVRQRHSSLTIQRFMLLRITKAYRTTSTEALQVVAGIMPLDLEIVKIRATFLYKKKGIRDVVGLDLRTCAI